LCLRCQAGEHGVGTAHAGLLDSSEHCGQSNAGAHAATASCPGRDSNPHALRQSLLRQPCLPFHHPGGSTTVAVRRNGVVIHISALVAAGRGSGDTVAAVTRAAHRPDAAEADADADEQATSLRVPTWPARSIAAFGRWWGTLGAFDLIM